MKTKILLVFSVFFLSYVFSSCQDKSKKVPVFENAEGIADDTDTTDENDDDEIESDIISIPFKNVGGVKTVEVKINDVIGVDMIIDTGCSDALISLSEARYLAEKGTLSQDDILGESKGMIADGSIVVNTRIILRKVTIGNKLCASNVEATVSDNISAPLLLGNEVFDRVKDMTIDNDNQQIIFHLK